MLRAKTKIKYNGQRYFPGQDLPQMDEKTEKSLIFAGSIVRVSEDGREVQPQIPSEPEAPVKAEDLKKPEVPEGPPAKPNFTKWKKDRLVKYGKKIGVELDESMLQGEMVEKLNAHLDARPSDGQESAATDAASTPAVTGDKVGKTADSGEESSETEGSTSEDEKDSVE